MWRVPCVPALLAVGHLAAAFHPLDTEDLSPGTTGAHSAKYGTRLREYAEGARPATQLHKVDDRAHALSQTLQDLLARKQKLMDAVEKKKEMLEAASKQHTSRKGQLDRLIEQSVQLDSKKEALQAKLQQLQRSKAAAGARASKVSFAKANSMVKLARDLEDENAVLQREIGANEERKEKLARDLKEMRQQGFAQAVSEARTRIHEEQADLHEFTQKFAHAQSELNKELSTVLQPWAKHWESQASNQGEDEDDELSNLEPQMHMKAYEKIRKFDAKLVTAAREQSCYFNERMGEQETAFNSVEKTMQPPTAEEGAQSPTGEA